MTQEEIKNDVSVSSRIKHITDEEQLKIIDFVLKNNIRLQKWRSILKNFLDKKSK